MPSTLRSVAANAYESRPSPQPMSITRAGMPSVSMILAQNVEPLVYSVWA